MTGRKTSAVRAPVGALRLLALDALQRYATGMGLLLPGDALLPVILDRCCDAE
jgi:hypothetical protein